MVQELCHYSLCLLVHNCSPEKALTSIAYLAASKEEKEMKTFLEEREAEMLQMLEKLVNIDSGSYVKHGIDSIGEILKGEYERLGFEVQVHPQQEYGNNISIKHPEATDPKIIIVAHMDTVFPDGTAKHRPFSRDEKRAYGPGVIDMKASQVAALYAMKALIENGEEAYKNVQIVLNSDEEIGSPSSRVLIEEKAKGKKYALIMEPGRADGSVVSERKGGGRYSIKITGKGAHAGIEPQKGRSAIEELAHKIIKLHGITNYDQGVTVNVGLIDGGTSVNTVSPIAEGHIDVRVVTTEQAQTTAKAIEEICSTPDVEGTSIELSGAIGRPPMFPNDKSRELLEVVKEVGAKLGVEIKDTKTGGGSDGNFTQAMGVATLDGLGPVGGNAHSDQEYLEINTFVERTLVLVETIKKLSE
jgi:glutamate carboxypeptidase